MSRTLSVLLLVVLLAIAGAGLMLYLAYGVDASVPAGATVPALAAPARIEWHDDGLAVIEAQREADAYAALGFVHGQQDAWNIVLWRQAAAGRLAEWFGDDLLDVDQVAHRLGLNALARESLGLLSDEDRALLRAYADGVNAALSARDAAYRSNLVVHDVALEPWEPWHTLAVERLFAWLSSPAPSPDTVAVAGPDAVAFFEADRRLRGWLHLHGFENSVAWAVTDSSGTHFLQRHVHGASALPVFREVSLHWPGVPRLMGATLPGTPFFPAGRTDARAWALLLHSPLRLVRTLEDTTAIRPSFERIVSADGTEHLIVGRRSASAVFFDAPPRPPAPPPPPDTSLALPDSARAAAGTTPAAPVARPDSVAAPDSTWSIRWAGFQAGSDWPAWRALASGNRASGDTPTAGAAPGAGGFRLFTGSGLAVSNSGALQVLGAPRLTHPLPGGLLVANADWTRYAAERLDTLLRTPDPARVAHDLIEDRFSSWAARLAPPMIESAATVPDQPPLVTEALTYLRNWDFRYDRASIAASIFDAWVTAYRDSVGTLPAAAFPDSLVYEPILRYRMLVRSVEALAHAYGANLSQWRWEKVQPRRYFFPATPPTVLSEEETPPSRRFAPLDLPGSGHPSTLGWGPSIVQTGLLAPAHWEGWISTQHWEAIEARRYRFDVDAFFGRYLVMDRPPVPVSLSTAAPPNRTTTLTPAASPAGQP